MNANAEPSMFPMCQHEGYLCASFPSCLGEKIKSVAWEEGIPDLGRVVKENKPIR